MFTHWLVMLCILWVIAAVVTVLALQWLVRRDAAARTLALSNTA